MSLAKKNMSHMTVVTCVLFSLCRCLRAVCLRSVCPAQDSLVTKKKSFFGWVFRGGGESDGLKKC